MTALGKKSLKGAAGYLRVYFCQPKETTYLFFTYLDSCTADTEEIYVFRIDNLHSVAQLAENGKKQTQKNLLFCNIDEENIRPSTST